MFLEILQNSHENTCAAVSFLIKPQALTCNFIKKETLAQAFYCEFCEISKYTFSYGTPPLAASGQSDFQKKGLKREREREVWRVRLPTKTVLRYPTLMLSSRRGHSIDVSNNIYGCLSGLSCRCFS